MFNESVPFSLSSSVAETITKQITQDMTLVLSVMFVLRER